MQLRKPYWFLFVKLLNIFLSLNKKTSNTAIQRKGRRKKKNLQSNEESCDQMFVPEVLRERWWNWERGYEDTEKEIERERSDEDTMKQTEKERGDLGTRRKKRSPLCFWQNASLPTNNAFDGFYSFSDFFFFIGKLDLLYAFNFFNLVLDLDSKTRAKEIRF